MRLPFDRLPLAMWYVWAVSHIHTQRVMGVIADRWAPVLWADNQNNAMVDIVNRRTFVANVPAGQGRAWCRAAMRPIDNAQPMEMMMHAAECQALALTTMQMDIWVTCAAMAAAVVPCYSCGGCDDCDGDCDGFGVWAI